MCNFLEYKGECCLWNEYGILLTESLLDSKIVYRRYASLFFIAGCASTDNELITVSLYSHPEKIFCKGAGSLELFPLRLCRSRALVHPQSLYPKLPIHSANSGTA